MSAAFRTLPPHPRKGLYVFERRVSLELLLLDEPALVLVDGVEGALDFRFRLGAQAACLEELLVVECASV